MEKLENTLQRMGYQVIVTQRAGKHIKVPGLPELKEQEVIKLYYRLENIEDIEDVEEKLPIVSKRILEMINRLKPLIDSGKIRVKYDEKGRLLSKINLLFAIYVPGYHFVVYVPYDINILKETLKRTIDAPYSKLVIKLGKTLKHQRIPLKEEDLEAIIDLALNEIKRELSSLKENYNYYKRYVNNIERSPDYKTELIKIAIRKVGASLNKGRALEFGRLEGGRVCFTEDNICVELSKKDYELAKKRVKQNLEKELQDISNKITILEKYYKRVTTLLAQRKYLDALRMLKELYQRFSYLGYSRYIESIKIEGNNAYVTNEKYEDVPDSLIDTISITKKISDRIYISYIPSKEEWAKKIEKLCKEQLNL